jgi:hypothetical protein
MRLFSRWSVAVGARRDRRQWARPALEPLEDRALLAVITVLNTNDAGPGSLRDALVQATSESGDTITFAPTVTGTITLTSALPDLSSNLTIDGPGASVLTVARSTDAGTPVFRIFNVPAGATVSLSRLTIIGGKTDGEGGGIDSNGTLSVAGCTLRGNTAGDYGGGLYSTGALTVTSSIVTGNSATYYAGIDNLGGTAALTGTTVSGNTADRAGGGVGSQNGTFVITDSTITNNVATYGAGGLIAEGGTVTVTGSTITGNTVGVGSSSGGFGGGISNESGTLSVVGSVVSNNVARGGDGGGIDNENGTVTVTGSMIAGNTAGSGGGLNTFGGTVTLQNTTVGGNSASKGGALDNTEATVTLTGCTFRDNAATTEGGGAFNEGMLSVINSTLSGNSAVGNGGGISNEGTLTVTSSTISGNSATVHGGGIDNSGSLSVIGSTVSGNTATGGMYEIFNPPLSYHGIWVYYGGQGGGIDSGGTLVVTNSTISGNSATGVVHGGSGGGIDNGGSLWVIGSTISGNTVTGYQSGGAGIDNQGIMSTTMSLFANVGADNFGRMAPWLGHNLFSSNPGLGLAPTDLVNTDPLLGPLADNGGPTFTCALLPGSPAIDAGVPVNGVTTDQRGIARPQGSAPDIGAFESRGFSLTVTGGYGQSAPLGTAFAAPLVVRVASPYGEPVAGGQVTFAVPATGATAILSSNPATIGADGLASVTATASGNMGSYGVSVGARGSAGGSAFALTNEVGITAQGLSVAAPGSAWFRLPVVTFRVANLAVSSPPPPASTFRAWVNWGDGTYSAGQVKLTPDGTYQIVASHRYKKAGTYRTTSQILAWPPGIVLSEV